jgi:hypothetical protein
MAVVPEVVVKIQGAVVPEVVVKIQGVASNQI